MGKVPDKDLTGEINQVAASIDGVCGVHDIKINYFGSYAILSLHIEVNPKLTLLDSHNLAHFTENKIKEEIEIIQEVIGHVCPYGEEYDHEQYIHYTKD